jgi:hypothetical protein
MYLNLEGHIHPQITMLNIDLGLIFMNQFPIQFKQDIT